MCKPVILAMAMAMALALGGCGLINPAFTTEAEGEALLVGKLQERYGIEFEVVENGAVEGSWNKRYTGIVAPVDAPDETASARVDSSGQLSDGWAVWQYADELMAAAWSACDLVSAEVVYCEATPHQKQTAQTWNPETTPIETYVSEATPFAQVQVEFIDAEPAMIAPGVFAMIQELDSGSYPYTFTVTRGTGNVIYHHTGSDAPPTENDIVNELH